VRRLDPLTPGTDEGFDEVNHRLHIGDRGDGEFEINFQQDKTGSIEAGKLADLIVLDHNLFTIEPTTISDKKVLLTLLGGRPVYGDFSLHGGQK